jgi:hypothetical protein
LGSPQLLPGRSSARIRKGIASLRRTISQDVLTVLTSGFHTISVIVLVDAPPRHEAARSLASFRRSVYSSSGLKRRLLCERSGALTVQRAFCGLVIWLLALS